MAVTKRFTDQIVVMQTPAMGVAIRKLAEELGLSVAKVARDAQTLGVPMLRDFYAKQGVTKPETEAQEAEAVSPALSGAERARRAGRAARGTKSRGNVAPNVPAVQFAAPN